MQRDSGGLGKNDTFVIDCQRIVVDLYPYMKENEKGLDDFKLDTIAKAILPQGGEGRKKVEIRYEDQFLMYTQSAKLEDHLKLADYVLTDADLVPDILTTYSAFEKLIAASIVAETPLTKMLGGKSIAIMPHQMLDFTMLDFTINLSLSHYFFRATSPRLPCHFKGRTPPRNDCKRTPGNANYRVQGRLRANTYTANGHELCLGRHKVLLHTNDAGL